MSVRWIDGIVRLEGECAVEDAETLLGLLQEHRSATVSLRECTRVHLAAMQVLLVARRPFSDAPTDPFLRDHLLPTFDWLPD